MFTGIVKGVFPVAAVEILNDFVRLSVTLSPELTEGLETGASVAVNGTCLTVAGIDRYTVIFDVMQETLRVTNIGDLCKGRRVNIERAARFGDEIGGHILSGHIHTMARVTEVCKKENNVTVFFHVSDDVVEYLLPKGYVALNGASLTIGAVVENNTFCVHLIPETLRLTTFGEIKVGDRINLEVDSQTQAVVDTVKRVMSEEMHK